MINDRIAQLLGKTFLPGAEIELEIVFGVGLATICLIPWIVQILFYSTKITMNKFALIYKSRCLIEKISWDEVIEITLLHLRMDEHEGGKEVIELKGKHGRLRIESQYDISTDSLLELLRDCWRVCTKTMLLCHSSRGKITMLEINRKVKCSTGRISFSLPKRKTEESRVAMCVALPIQCIHWRLSG